MAITSNIQAFIDDIVKMSNAEQMSLGNVIWNDTFSNEELLKSISVRTGVKFDDKIPFGDFGNGYKFMQSTSALASQCDEIPYTANVTLSTKTWQPARYSNTIEECFKDLDRKFLDFFNSDLCSIEEMTASAFVSFLKNLVSSYLQDSIWVKTYFAEKSSTEDYLKGNDGVFVKLLALAPSGDTRRVVIPENAGADYATQDALDPERGLNVFKALYKQRSRNLKKNKKAYIKTTRDLAENYLEWLQEQKQVTCCQKDPLVGVYTLDTLTIFGIPIKIEDRWDDIIDDVFDNGTKKDNPHRALLIDPDNMPVGTCEVGQFSDFKLKVDTYNDKFKFTPEYTIDVQILKENEFVLAI